MKHGAAWTLTGLAAIAAASWSADITADAENISGHIEHDLLGIACVATASAIVLTGVWLIIALPLVRALDKNSRSNERLARAVLTRPLDSRETGPQRALRAVPPNGRGRHASSR